MNDTSFAVTQKELDDFNSKDQNYTTPLLTSDMFSQEDRIAYFFLSGWLAYDPNSGAYLYKSQGKRKAYRASRYTVVHPKLKAHKIMAWTDRSAIHQANSWLRLVAPEFAPKEESK